MEALLDTNFIISCLLKKIDFLTELEGMGFKTVVPREVLDELKDLKKDSKISHYERISIVSALEILENKKIKKMKLGKKSVDDALIERGKSGTYIATLDRGIKNKIPNKIVISNATKKLVIERD
jgi:rRNA-processing protein FCF1